MALNTKSSDVPTLNPEAPGLNVQQPVNSGVIATPDPRDVAATSEMPNLPIGVQSSSSKLSTITAALSFQRFLPITYGQSAFIPSFILLSMVLSRIDTLMAHTYRFNQSSPDWHPLISQIYYGIIFIVHILRVRRASSVITESENAFLDWFETNFPFQTLPIAGPLKHFFQSITVVPGIDKFYGNIIPDLPPFGDCQYGNWYMPNYNTVRMHLPPLPLLMDGLNHIFQDRPASNTRAAFDPYDATHWRDFHLQWSHFANASTANTPGYYAHAGMTYHAVLTPQQMVTFYTAARHIPFPARLDATNNPTLTTIGEWMRFGTNNVQQSAWFTYVIGIMQRHAQFMTDSTNLASIAIAGLGAVKPIIKIRPNPHISLENPGAATVIRVRAAVPPVMGGTGGNVPLTPGRPAGHYVAIPLEHFKITATVKVNNLHVLAEQFALLSAINVSTAGLPARGNSYSGLPADANMRAGPFWELPDRRVYTEIDVLGQIANFLSGAFHRDQRLV